MNTTTHRIRFAGRLGHWLGRGWRAYTRGERRASAWLVSQGVPVAGAAMALWVMKLSALAVFLYAMFWLVLPLLAAVGYVWLQTNGFQEEDRWLKTDELRNGEAGFGLYASSGQRIDPHDPNDPFDR